MKRISTDAEYLDDGKVTIDADGIPVDLVSASAVTEVHQEQQAIRQRVSAIEPKPAGGVEDAAFAHVTEQGHRLPLGYTSDGRLDELARRIWAEDVTGTYETADGEYAHAVVTGDMHLLWGVKSNGTVEIPGLKSSANEPYYVHRDGSIQATAADTGNITVWGSSTPNLLIPAVTSAFADLPVTVNDMAQGGERAEHTAARLGAVPALIDPVTIPASGAVDVTSPNFPISSAVWGIRGFLGGVYGILNSTSSSVYFTRLSEGEAVQIDEQTEFIPERGPEMRDHISLVGAGKNNISGSTVEETCKLNDQIFEYLTPLYPRVLWLGMHHNTGEVNERNRKFVDRCNAYFEKRFGAMYFDIKAVITSPDIWDRVGLTPTSGDLAEQAAGNLAPSLAMDGAHLSEATNAIVAADIRTRMSQLGWY